MTENTRRTRLAAALAAAVLAAPTTLAGCASDATAHERSALATTAGPDDRPRHPGDLKEHAILNFQPTGTTWSFDSAAGRVSVKVQPRLNTNEAQLLLSAALAGNGVAILGAYLARAALDSGALVPLLADYPLDALWLKALLPENRANVPKVQALVRHLKAALAA